VSLRHTGALARGTKTLLEAIEELVGIRGGAELWGRDVLANASRESLEREYNVDAKETTLFVNSRARPDRDLRALVSRPSSFAAVAGGELVAARLPGRSMDPGVVRRKEVDRISKKVERLEAPQESLFRGYWDLVDSNGLAVAEQAGYFTDSLALPEAVDVKGPPSNLRIEGTAEVEKYVAFDVRPGPVVVERGAIIESFSRITGPAFIGANTKVHSALVEGGTSVFEGCSAGGQVK
jgi:hypothetical protein